MAIRVGYQGEPGAYSEEAALALFPGASTTGHRSFQAAFTALIRSEVEVCVLPVENTLAGLVLEVNDLLWESRGLRVEGEYVHPIRHCLLGRGGRIERAISHPQALAQCRRYLEGRGIQAIPFHDTAGAARHLAEHPEAGLAAIASIAAARRYGLDVLAEAIQDDESNRTRFLVVRRGEPDRPAAAEPGGKCALAFVAAHRPGSLVEALQCLSSRSVNLTRLDSRPVLGRPFQYRFYIDFEVEDPAAAEDALSALEKTAAEVRLFGTYRALTGPAAD